MKLLDGGGLTDRRPGGNQNLRKYLPQNRLQLHRRNALVSDAGPEESCDRRCLSHALCRMELDLAGDQDRAARSPADFLRGHPFRRRDTCAPRRLDRASAIAAALSRRIPDSGVDRSAHVRRELRVAILGRTTRVVRFGSRVAGDDTYLRNGVRPLDAAGRAAALATG